MGNILKLLNYLQYHCIVDTNLEPCADYFAKYFESEWWTLCSGMKADDYERRLEVVQELELKLQSAGIPELGEQIF